MFMSLAQATMNIIISRYVVELFNARYFDVTLVWMDIKRQYELD